MAGDFLKYSGPLHANDLPVDSHELIAIGAPRPVFISAGKGGYDLLLRRRTLRTRVTLFASRQKRRRRSARDQRKCIMAPRQLRIRGARTSGDAGL